MNLLWYVKLKVMSTAYIHDIITQSQVSNRLITTGNLNIYPQSADLSHVYMWTVVT